MICIKCQKFYLSRAYYEKHLQKDSCLRKINNAKPVKKEPIKINIEIEKQLIKKERENFEFLENEILELKSKYESLNTDFNLLKIDHNQLKEKFNNIEKNTPKESLSTIKSDIIEDDDSNFENIKIVKMERMNIDDDIIRNFLKQKSLSADCGLLNYYYLENTKKNLYPIKRHKTKKMDCYYWNGSDWIEDNSGNNLKNIFINNLKKVYNKVNLSGSADYLDNQEYINNIGATKYKTLLYNFFIESYL